MKLTGLSRLNVAALELVYDGERFVATKSTFVNDEDPTQTLDRIADFMAAQTDVRHHPYASLHAVVRKLRKIEGPTTPAQVLASKGEAPVAQDGPSQADIETALDQLQVELESPEFAAAVEEGFDMSDPGDREDAYAQLDPPVVPDDHPVRLQLEVEISRLREEADRLDADMTRVQAEYDKVWAKEKRYDFESVPPKVRQESDRLSAEVVKLLDQGKTVAEKLNQLTAPAELERRMQDADAKTLRIERIKTMADKAPKKQTAREMGAPDEYLSDSGNFRPGMDARYKSDLVNSALGIKDKKALMTFTVEDAETRLQIRGWTGFLTRKREILAAKAEKASSKPKATRKAAAKPKATKAAGEVKPDPKPKAKAKRRGGRLQSKAGATS